MEKAKVISILDFYKTIDKEIKLNADEQQEIEDRYYCAVNGIALDGMPTGKGGISSATESVALNVPDGISQTLKALKKERSSLLQIKAEIRKELNKLPYIQRVVIMGFYVSELQWVQISERIHYSERQCKNIRCNALNKLGKQLSENQLIVSYSFPQ